MDGSMCHGIMYRRYYYVSTVLWTTVFCIDGIMYTMRSRLQLRDAPAEHDAARRVEQQDLCVVLGVDRPVVRCDEIRHVCGEEWCRECREPMRSAGGSYVLVVQRVQRAEIRRRQLLLSGSERRNPDAPRHLECGEEWCRESRER